MKCVFFAESAILVHLKSVGVVLFVFHCVVISLLTFCTSKCNLYAHYSAPPVKNFASLLKLTGHFFAQKNKPCLQVLDIIARHFCRVNSFFEFILGLTIYIMYYIIL